VSRLASAAAWPMSLLLALTGCASPSSGPRVQDVDGAWHTPLDARGDDVRVLIFTSDECPIANAYAPTLGRLHEAWSEDPRVRLYLVHVDPDMTGARAAAHAREYRLPGTLLLDPTHALARACGATVTPEAVVRTEAGQVYRGRIDDLWRGLGRRGQAASSRDLADAVALARAGRRVPEPHPRAVGCLLPEPRR